ncbi:endonuclease/exonuclease/phosphatase family protein [Thalassoglobus sp. JC818]|uniref:endonuclease/exonuclease/phosphatase family protein n=1 Tax=Thalassoglobus sp. JC818 TaxID=3232136 RepID=UPI00345A35E1
MPERDPQQQSARTISAWLTVEKLKTVNWLTVISALVAVAVVIPTVLSLMARWFWPLDLLTHFRIQIAAIQLAVAAILLLIGRFKIAIIPVVALIWNVTWFGEYLIPHRQVDETSVQVDESDLTSNKLRVMSVNVFTRNRNHDRLIEVIRKHQPDIVLILEVNDRWSRALQQLNADYPHSLHSPREDNFGMAVFSRIPFIESGFQQIGRASLPMFRGQVQLDSERIEILGFHVLPPTRTEGAMSRNEDLVAIAQIAEESPHPMIVLGDMNCTPWSPYFRDVCRTGKLRDSRIGFEISGTWPAGNPFVRLPIDHILVSPEFSVTSFSNCNNISSDHLPVLATLRLAK